MSIERLAAARVDPRRSKIHTRGVINLLSEDLIMPLLDSMTFEYAKSGSAAKRDQLYFLSLWELDGLFWVEALTGAKTATSFTHSVFYEGRSKIDAYSKYAEQMRAARAFARTVDTAGPSTEGVRKVALAQGNKERRVRAAAAKLRAAKPASSVPVRKP